MLITYQKIFNSTHVYPGQIDKRSSLKLMSHWLHPKLGKLLSHWQSHIATIDLSTPLKLSQNPNQSLSTWLLLTNCDWVAKMNSALGNKMLITYQKIFNCTHIYMWQIDYRCQ